MNRVSAGTVRSPDSELSALCAGMRLGTLVPRLDKMFKIGVDSVENMKRLRGTFVTIPMIDQHVVASLSNIATKGPWSRHRGHNIQPATMHCAHATAPGIHIVTAGAASPFNRYHLKSRAPCGSRVKNPTVSSWNATRAMRNDIGTSRLIVLKTLQGN